MAKKKFEFSTNVLWKFKFIICDEKLCPETLTKLGTMRRAPNLDPSGK